MRSNHRRGSALFTEKATFPKVRIRVRNALFILTVLCSILLGAKQLWAAPTSAIQAEKVVRGWLRVDAEPMGTRLGGNVQRVDTFVDGTAQPLYYVVYLEPQGFVILPADDQIEPIIAFARQGEYDPSLDNPLGALVNSDLGGRVPAARQLTAKRKKGMVGKTLGHVEAALQTGADKAQSRWRNMRDFGEVSDIQGADDGPLISQFVNISDVRVAPLLLSEWDQGDVGGAHCYNYYTPENYVCGCVATAMAQLMRYHEYPLIGIGRHNFLITVDGQTHAAKTLGGNGAGGPYLWSLMELIPAAGVTEIQRQAIGTLCFDAGISVNMDYSAGGSGASGFTPADRLKDLFLYSNVVKGYNNEDDIGQGLTEMVNPNLDAKHPVLFSIYGTGGHEIVCDGYGYQGISMYHHLNMGWGGARDLWYHLPNIDSYDTVAICLYNIFVNGSGEIISGRVIDMAQEPIAGVEITGEVTGCDPCDPCTVCIFTATTDSNGIYALLNAPSDANFVITADKEDFYFESQQASTGFSEDMQPVAGNVWGIDFVAQPPPPDNDECEQAIPLQLNIPSYFTSFGATGDSLSSCSDGTDNKDAWHTFTPPSSTYFQFSLCDSTFDTTLTVYDDCNELSRVELGCNDNSEHCGLQSELVLQLDADETCYIRVAGVNSATGAYVITITEANFLEYNDDCEDAISLVDGVPFEGNTDDATETMIGEEPLTSSCSLLDEIDVWHSYTPTEDCCDVVISLCGSLFDTSLSVYDSCGGTELACNEDSDQCGTGSYQSYLTMPMQAGVTYYIRVAGFSRATGAYTITATGGGGGLFGILPPHEFTWLYGEPVQDYCLEAVGGEEPYHNWQASRIVDYYDYETETGSFGSNGTGNGWQDDDAMWSFALPFPFNFYGTEYNSVNVCSNGFLDFVETLTLKNNSTQKLTDNVIIAPLWDDLNTSVGVGSDIYIYQAASDEVTFRWQAVTWDDETPCNFSVTLYEDRRIRFDYGSGNTNLTPTVGISAGNGNDYLIIPGYDGAETLTDADSVIITFHESGSALPPGVSLDTDTGCFSGAPRRQGDYNAIIEVTDSFYPQVTAQEDFVFHVISPNDPDLNDDGFVNLLDFAIISTQWLANNCNDQTDWCQKVDINMSGRVDMTDLTIMVENWLGGNL